MKERKIRKGMVHEEADRYLNEYPNMSAYNISKYVWSDYTSMPGEYQRPSLATKIINRITYLKR
jgi:hypothetical protein